jgi:hypothetical protein
MAIRDSPFISFTEITEELYGDSIGLGRDLSQCFVDSVDASFDSTHRTNDLGTKNNLLNFRNYNDIPTTCNINRTDGGGTGYPISQTTAFGSSRGAVILTTSVGNVPDRFIVIWNGFPVIDTGYQSNDYATYNILNSSARSNFKNALNGKTAPERPGTYPFPAGSGIFPNEMASDGYPILYPARHKAFDKNTSTSDATVEVYAPMATDWGYVLNCPKPYKSYDASYSLTGNSNHCAVTDTSFNGFHDGANETPDIPDYIFEQDRKTLDISKTRKYTSSDGTGFIISTNSYGRVNSKSICP